MLFILIVTTALIVNRVILIGMIILIVNKVTVTIIQHLICI